ncbi:MAG: hypothetical protein AAF738_01640 [Bacteroidota bacterium]
MKYLSFAFVFCLCFSTFSLTAQRDNSLFNTSGRFGVFGAPIWEFSGLSVETAARGGGGGFVLGNTFLGVYGSGEIDWRALIDGDDVQISSGHGGLWVGYVPFQSSVIHPYISTRFGWGAADIELVDTDVRYKEDFFVLTPEAGVEVNVFRWFRVAGTVGYQWYNGLADSPEIGDFDTNNLHAALTLRFGFFGKDKQNCRTKNCFRLRR